MKTLNISFMKTGKHYNKRLKKTLSFNLETDADKKES